ncbi:MAG: cysteine--tRNA ligase [Rhodospirillales bacterium]|nr:cysteine--tRNA ligase [Rhodospirillales bacterium]
MSIALYNTLARAEQRFEPLDPGNVRLYVCGPTVYDWAHVGNARPAVVFDVLFRLLRCVFGDGHVTYVRNITDIDDKIIAAHRASGEPVADITRRTTDAYHADVAALGCLPPTIEPRATAHLAEMQAMIAQLVGSGHAYVAEGHVLFHVPSMPDYGRLSRRDLDEMIAGARVEVAPYKRDPRDFVLWKPAAEEDPGWDSPWGRGRPGWHIECSAMSGRYLSETFDIHGGGADLIFPHHENEIAQSTCAHGGRPFARFWLHNGYLMTEGAKMSKSLGNFYTVHDLLAEFPGEAIRLALLQTHYRQPLDFTREGVGQAKRTLDRFYGALRGAGGAPAPGSAGKGAAADTEVIAALGSDLNTPLALAVLHERLTTLNRAEGAAEKAAARAALLAAGAPLGLLAADPAAWMRGETGAAAALDEDSISSRIAARAAARKARDFHEADRLRADLLSEGIILEDTPAGTIWRRA